MKDMVTELLTKRAQIMSWIETCPEEEDETVASALIELDTKLALQKSTTPMGKALSLVFLEYELVELLRGAPDIQRNVIAAYISNLRQRLPKVPADIAKVLRQR